MMHCYHGNIEKLTQNTLNIVHLNKGPKFLKNAIPELELFVNTFKPSICFLNDENLELNDSQTLSNLSNFLSEVKFNKYNQHC